MSGLMAWRVAAASFYLEPNDLTQALNEWSRQSDMQVLFDFHLTQGHLSPAVACECSIAESLAMLLAGTELVFDFVNERTVSVTLDPHLPPPATPEEVTAWMRRFEPVAQAYAEGQGPAVKPLILVFPVQAELASR